MADVSDVESALVTAAAAALYPEGASRPSAVNMDVKIFRGWPVADALDRDMAAGRACVSVFPVPGASRDTTRFADAWEDVTPSVCPVRVTTAGGVATFSGLPDPSVLCGARAHGIAYARRCVAEDTPETVAAALAALVPGAVAVGATLRVPGAPDFDARADHDRIAEREARRQTQDFTVTCWCPTPDSRDRIAAVVDGHFALHDWLTLADGTECRLTYGGSTTRDEPGKAAVWRRDLRYRVEYATVERVVVPPVLFVVGTTGGCNILA